jgi:hypothetical protein
LLSKIEKVDVGRPFGEMFMCLPVSGAEAVKKTCWARAWYLNQLNELWFVLDGELRKGK